MRISLKPGSFFTWHKTVKNKFLIWTVFFLVFCILWFACTVFLAELFTGAGDPLVSVRRYSGLFFIVWLLSLLYPFFTFWRTDIHDLEVDEKICEQNYVECFFIRHVIPVMLVLFLIVVCAYVLFEYLAYRQGEQIKNELAEITEVKARRLDEWRAQHLEFALLSDGVLHKRNNAPTVMEKKRQEKRDEAWLRSRHTERQSTPQLPVVQEGASWQGGAFNTVALKFLGARGVVSVKSGDEVDEKALPRGFIQRVRLNKTISIGPMSRIKGHDGAEYHGFYMAVPVMDEKAPDQVKSILVYHVDPSGFLYPYMDALMANRPGEQTLLLQKEVSGLRVLGRRFDEMVIPDTDERKHGAGLSKAVLNGQAGFLKGVDVRGEPVVACVARIANSDWYVAQQVDEKEISRQIRYLAWLVILVTVLFIVLAAFLIFLWLRHCHLRYEAQHLKLALRQQALIQHYDFLSKYANNIILLMDDVGNIVEANDRAEVAYGCSRIDLIGQNIRHLLAPLKLADFEVRWNQLKKEQSLIFETAHLHQDGSLFPVEVSARLIKAEGELFIQCIIRDITEKKRSEELIWQQANFDQITGLANRRMFMEALHHEIRKASRTSVPMALMFLDLDKFKEVNDTLGHAVGDLLLQQVAERLKTCVRETDIVARLGGDEFTVILSGLVNFRSVKRVAKNILREMARPFALEKNVVHVSSSMGITFFPEDAGNADALLKNADQAMYAAKKAGGNCYHYFTRSMQEAVQTRLLLISDLRCALDKNQFEVVYQPILNPGSGRINHAEALIRWHHPERGVIGPAEFIPLAEEAGIIQDFSEWVFLQAARQARKWQELIPDFRMGLNVSPVQFKKGGINIHTWVDYLNDLSLSPESIIVEITERLLLDLSESIVHQLLAFRDAGISVALDDFGSGYSSLSCLPRLDIDYVKIDRIFTHNIVHNKDDRTLCEAMTLMAHKLGIQVVAEGVECQEQLDVLMPMGCDYVQGFLVSEALSAEECEKFILSFSDLKK